MKDRSDMSDATCEATPEYRKYEDKSNSKQNYE